MAPRTGELCIRTRRTGTRESRATGAIARSRRFHIADAAANRGRCSLFVEFDKARALGTKREIN